MKEVKKFGKFCGDWLPPLAIGWLIGNAYMHSNWDALFGFTLLAGSMLLSMVQEYKYKCLLAHYNAVLDALNKSTEAMKEVNDAMDSK